MRFSSLGLVSFVQYSKVAKLCSRSKSLGGILHVAERGKINLIRLKIVDFPFAAVAPKNTIPFGAFIRVDTPRIVIPIISKRRFFNSVSGSPKQPSKSTRVYPVNSSVMSGSQLHFITLRCRCRGE